MSGLDSVCTPGTASWRGTDHQSATHIVRNAQPDPLHVAIGRGRCEHSRSIGGGPAAPHEPALAAEHTAQRSIERPSDTRRTYFVWRASLYSSWSHAPSQGTLEGVVWERNERSCTVVVGTTPSRRAPARLSSGYDYLSIWEGLLLTTGRRQNPSGSVASHRGRGGGRESNPRCHHDARPARRTSPMRPEFDRLGTTPVGCRGPPDKTSAGGSDWSGCLSLSSLHAISRAGYPAETRAGIEPTWSSPERVVPHRSGAKGV